MKTEALVKQMNDQMNREISTFLRYIVQAASIRGAENETARDMYRAEVADEVGHAQYLAEQIVELGGTPRVDPELPDNPPANVRDMLHVDAAAEDEDVHRYRKLVSMADEHALAGLKLKLEEQAADEDEHGQKMRRLLGATREGAPSG